MTTIRPRLSHAQIFLTGPCGLRWAGVVARQYDTWLRSADLQKKPNSSARRIPASP